MSDIHRLQSDHAVTLDDKYCVERGRVYMTGIQALVRIPLDQMRRDAAAGLKTATFISGYRGSPLGGYDTQLRRAQKLLDKYNVNFQPGVNEELGATAVWGSQQVNLFPGARFDGVCGIWYGKSPGVDRSSDVFRHGNAAGSSKFGGVLVIAGDDHGCKSSSYPGQSEFAFVDMSMPVLNPATVQEVLDYGLYGLALSRFSGNWVAMITLTENMDSGATVDIDPGRVQITLPDNVKIPEGGLNIRHPDTPLAQEERTWQYKRPAALAFARANQLNRVLIDNPDARLGIVTAGKAHLDVMQAFAELGIREEKIRELGIRVLKVGMTYPLDVENIREFARGLDYLLVVEEKRSLMEVQLKEELYNVEVIDPHFPKIIGKVDEFDRYLLPSYGELSPAIIARVLVKLLPQNFSNDNAQQRLCAIDDAEQCVAHTEIKATRIPFFCSGCPHNTSTKVPEGSRALAGIGCHYLVQWMDRRTDTFTQMGGEGVTWVGQAPFTDTKHVFVNLGDGTYFHSGILAIRAAIAAKVNITYKILFNGAVAMTGGQPHDGPLSAQSICTQVLAEGPSKVALVMDDVKKYGDTLHLPKAVAVYPREDFDALQLDMRETPGVTVIVYDQTCATELRRARKRKLAPPATKRAFINDEVCEGCGDCSVQSNCLSIEPKPTSLGVKRQINQNSCNQDMSCVKGFCPSFVTVEGGKLRKPAASAIDFVARGEALPAPTLPALDMPFNLLVTGVGGTGVVTIGALVSMAAHLEGKAVTVLDQTGLAQKGGGVYSHIRVAADKSTLHAVRISTANADALIACDLVAAANGAMGLAKLDPAKTVSILNTDIMPTADFVLGHPQPNDEQDFVDALAARSRSAIRIDGYGLTQKVMGSTTTANIFILGFAWQRGCVPVGLPALYRAIELNGIAIDDNIKAFNAGRCAAVDMVTFQQALGGDIDAPAAASLESIVSDRVARLTAYQNSAYAERYRQRVQAIAAQEQRVRPGSSVLAEAVARYYFKLLAYKDEYEVARMYSDGEFMRKLKDQFDGEVRLTFNLAPPLLSKPDVKTGVARKMTFGPWMLSVFGVLAKFKFLRGTPFDPFGYLADRKVERELIARYERVLDELLPKISADNIDMATAIAAIPDQIRGYGHIKNAAIQEAEARENNLLERFRSGDFDMPPVKQKARSFYEVTL